ncbi:MAG TPA: zinc ABC transporter substrate-binding protein, partial [Myxococcota bacterium]
MQRVPGGTRVLCALLLAVACGPPQAADERPVVAVSVLPLAYFVDRISAERVRTVVMLPPGASPHSYEPSMGQLVAISHAQLYVKVGHPDFPFEATWLDTVLAAAGAPPVVDAASGGEVARGDPHVWLSLRHVRALNPRLEEALAALEPEARGMFAANRRALDAEVDAVERELRERLAPHRGSHFLVFHPAWGYLAREFGLTQQAIERDGKSPDAYALGRLIESARAGGVETIFAQPHFDRGSAETIAHEIGARVELLDPLAYDWPA